MTKIWKRFFLALWWRDWGRTLALNRWTIGRGCFRMGWSEEECRPSTRGRVLGTFWKPKQRTVTRRGVSAFWVLTAKATPDPFLSLSRGVYHTCRNFKIGRQIWSLTLDSPSLDTIQTSEWHLACVSLHIKQQRREKLTLKSNVSPVFFIILN